MAKYLVDGNRVMTGRELLVFAKKRHRDNNKGRNKPKNVGQAISFLRTSVKGAGAGSKSHTVDYL